MGLSLLDLLGVFVCLWLFSFLLGWLRLKRLDRLRGLHGLRLVQHWVTAVILFFVFTVNVHALVFIFRVLRWRFFLLTGRSFIFCI